MTKRIQQHKTISIVLFCLCFFSFGYFFQSGAHNQNARLDLTRAIVELGTFHIDRFAYNTADVIRYKGHVYPAQAPGSALLAVPSFALFSTAFQHIDLPKELKIHYICYLTIWFTLGLISSLLIVLFYHVLTFIVRDPSTALYVTLAYAFGTIAFPYSTIYFGHQIVAALLFASFSLVFLYKEGIFPNLLNPSTSKDKTWRIIYLAFAGFCSGFCLTTEYPTLIAVIPLCIYVLLVLPCKKDMLWFLFGLGTGGFFLVIYNFLAFGDIFFLPHSILAKMHDSPYPHHGKGFLGLGLPDLSILLEITFKPMRGIFYCNPWLILGIPALAVPLFVRKYRAEMLFCAYMMVAYSLFNSSLGSGFSLWSGGTTMGARHLVPALPFIVLLITPLLRFRLFRYPFYALAFFSAGLMLMATSVNPRAPYFYRNPIRDYHVENYLNGQLSVHFGGMFNDVMLTSNSVSFNLAKLLEFPAHLQLLPLFIFWLIMCCCLCKLTRTRAAIVEDHSSDKTASDPPPPLRPQTCRLRIFGGLCFLFLAVLFSTPFLFSDYPSQFEKANRGLNGTYVPQLIWPVDHPNAVSTHLPTDAAIKRRIDTDLIFPTRHDLQALVGPVSIEWQGHIYIPENGHYTFATHSDDGSALFIDQQLVVDNWGKHPGRTRRGRMTLTKGVHSILIRYFNAGGRGAFRLLWARPKRDIQLFPSRLLLTSHPENIE